MKCCVCRRDRGAKDMQHIILTEEERAVVRRQGIEATEYWYCRPCFAVLSNREQGAQLIKGTLQVNLTASGNLNAEKIAQKVYTRLIEKTAKGPKS